MDADDNPYLVFESLNAKGRPLTQADLIRNYFFMRIHVDKQDLIYNEYWNPMQNSLGEKMTEFIRHFLMRNGANIKQADVYYSLKEVVVNIDVEEYLKELFRFSNYYLRLVNPEFEEEPELEKYFRRLNRIEVTTAYPFLLNIYDIYANKKISKNQFVDILKILENYLIRRFICGIPTNQLNKIFPTIFIQLNNNYSDNIVEGLKNILQSKGYPRDNEFKTRLKETRLYGSGDRLIKSKLILETLEEQYNHKESISFDNLTIEHIMPQTLSEWWQNHLGEEWEEVHDLYLHTIGNLTLTAYNTELSNDDFLTKKKTFNESHIDLNKYFSQLNAWRKSEIEERAECLVEKCASIWNYFGQEQTASADLKSVSGTVPKELSILGQKFNVNSWRDVLEQTLNTIADLEPDKFEVIANNYPRYVGKDKNKFRAIRQLQNNYFIEVNLSAQSIQKICHQAIETIELTHDDWFVEIE